MENLRRSIGIDVQLEDGRSLRTECAFIVRAARVAFDVDDLAFDRVDECCATYGAIRANARCNFRVFDPEFLRSGYSRPKIYA